MKIRLLLAMFLVAALPVCLMAQAPQLVNYQAVARNASGNVLVNQTIKVRLSVNNNSATGTTVYQETHAAVTTNQFGLFTVAVGGGTPGTGTFSGIDWSNGAKFLKVEVDFNNTGTFSDMGTSQLLSVPYALYAKNVENDNDHQTLSIAGTTLTISGGNTVTLPTGGSADNWGTQTVVTGNTLTGTGVTASPLNIAQQGAITGQVLKWNGSAWAPAPDTNTDNQSLNLNGSTLSITGGNSVTLPSGGTSYTAGSGIGIAGGVISNTGDLSNTNEIQTLAVSGNQLTISGTGGNSVTLPTGTTYTAGSGINIAANTISATDNSAINEIQALSLTGSALSLSNGGGSVTLPDASATNEIQTLSVSGNQLSISGTGGNTVTMPTGTTYTAGSGINITGNAISATDNSTTNEIQTITLTGNNLALSNGGGSVTLPTGTTYTAGNGISLAGNVITNTGDADNSTSNEIQTLSLTGSTLSLSNGGGNVTLPAGTSYSPGTGIGIAGGVITNTGDVSTTNELQSLSLSGNTLSISNGNSVSLPTGTDAQTLSLSGNTLSISNGNNVALPTGTTYTAGTGITFAGNTINSLWTANGTNIYNNNTGNVGIGTTTPAYPLHALGSNATSVGVVSNANAAGIGLSGQNTASAGTGLGNGLFGATQQSNGFGVYGENLNTNGTGILGVGNNVSTYTLPIGGSGGAFYGSLTGGYGFSAGVQGYGLYGKATNATSAYGVVGISNGVLGTGPLEGAGGAFTGYNYGVSGGQTNASINTQTAGGYFVSGYDGVSADATTLVEAWSTANTHYKIWENSTGAVATSVPDMNGNAVTLHAPETPEFYFQDYGEAKLVNGKVHIDIDPILA